MSASVDPPPHLPPEDENEVQRNIRLKVCAYCKKPGARLKCKACLQRTYCDKKCQKNDWKTVHREQCEKLQQCAVAVDDEVAHPCPVCLDNEDTCG